jgi:hypothetical protein
VGASTAIALTVVVAVVVWVGSLLIGKAVEASGNDIPEERQLLMCEGIGYDSGCDLDDIDWEPGKRFKLVLEFSVADNVGEDGDPHDAVAGVKATTLTFRVKGQPISAKTYQVNCDDWWPFYYAITQPPTVTAAQWEAREAALGEGDGSYYGLTKQDLLTPELILAKLLYQLGTPEMNEDLRRRFGATGIPIPLWYGAHHALANIGRDVNGIFTVVLGGRFARPGPNMPFIKALLEGKL